MNLKLQIYSLLFSFFFGIFLAFLFIHLSKYFFKYNNLLSNFLVFLFSMSMSILYFLILLKLNNGILHIYFLILIILGFIIYLYNFYKIRKK